MAYNHFDYVPSSVNIGRSVFKFEKAVGMGVEVGYLYPMCAPVRMLPGSSLKLNLGMEIRSGALIAPLMDEFFCDVFAFNVPNRIVWEHWKQFLGAVDDVLYDYKTDYDIPSFSYSMFYQEITGYSEDKKAYIASHLLASCFELPPTTDFDDQLNINALPFRGYTFIWNEFFRPEQLVDPILFSKTDDGSSGQNMSYSEVDINFNSITLNLIAPSINASLTGHVNGGCVLPTFRVHKSLWTSCLPKPSLESPSIISAVGIQATTSVAANTVRGLAADAAISSGSFGSVHATNSASSSVSIGELEAHLTVNNLRETLLLQRYYDVLNRAGSRYDELLRNLFT